MIEKFIKSNTNYSFNNGIYEIMNDEFRTKIFAFEKQYIPLKKNSVVDEISNYNLLPINPNTHFVFEWKLRQEGLTIVEKEIDNKTNLTVLEVSCSNGWLSHHLHNWGHDLVSVDYFNDEMFGLKSKFKYENSEWLTVQCDVENLTFFEPVFDLIIVNHSIQFFKDVESTIMQLKKLLNPKGKIIFLGLFIFINDEIKRKAVKSSTEKHFEKYGFNLFFAPTKGFLNKKDFEIFSQLNVRLKPYKCCWKGNFIANFLTKRGKTYYGIFTNYSQT